MQFLVILAVLAAIVIAEASPEEPVAGAGPRVALAVAGVALVALFAQVSSNLIARRLRARPERAAEALRRFRRLRHVHAALWLGAAGAILCCLEWGPLVRFNWGLDRVVLLDELLVLAPVLLPLVLSWAAFYQVETAVHARLVALGAADDRPCRLSRYLALHIRHYLGILLLPVLVLLAIQDVVELAAPGWLRGAHGAAVHAPLLGALLLGFPVLLRHIWQTEPLGAGPLRQRLESVAAELGFPARDILVWNTGGLVVNAAVTGFVRRLRYVFLSDGLLARLRPEQVEAVFAHELGHVRHRHLPLRLAAMFLPLSLWLLLGQISPEAAGQLEGWIAGQSLTSRLPAALAGLALAAIYMLALFGWYSRLLEQQADLFACRYLARRMPPPEAAALYAGALEDLAAAAGSDRRRAGWQHASVTGRVDLIVRAAHDPRRERRFERRMSVLGALIAGLAAAPLIGLLLAG